MSIYKKCIISRDALHGITDGFCLVHLAFHRKEFLNPLTCAADLRRCSAISRRLLLVERHTKFIRVQTARHYCDKDSIAIFVHSGLLGCTLALIKIDSVSQKVWLYQNAFAFWAVPGNGSVEFAVASILFWMVCMTILYRKRIFIRI